MIRLELPVIGGADVALHTIRYVGVYVKGGRRRGPVPGALLAVDGAPRKRRAFEAEVARAAPRLVDDPVAPAQYVGGRHRVRVSKQRQHECLRVPEGVPVIARPGQTLGGDRALLRSRRRLQDVEHCEPDRLLDLGIAVELHIGPAPELFQVLALSRRQPAPAVGDGRGQGAADLRAQGRRRAQARPCVGHELDHAKRTARPELGDDRQARVVVIGLHRLLGATRPAHLVVHRRGHPQPGHPGRVHQHRAHPLVTVVARDQRRLELPGGARVLALHRRVAWLVGDELRLQDDVRRSVDRLDLVLDGGQRAVHQRDQAPAAHAHSRVGW